MSKTWEFFFGVSRHGPESSCHISAYKFFPGLHVFCRISTGLTICCSHTLANLTATPLRIEHFSVSESPHSLSAFAVSLSAFANERKLFNLLKMFSIRSAVFLELYRLLRGFAVHSPSN